MDTVGITERGDAALDLGWLPWVKEGNPAILITKDPDKLYRIITGIQGHENFNIIIHATITGLGRTIIEPGVPPYKEALLGYKRLIDVYSENRIVLRIDPIIPIDSGAKLALKVLDGCAGTRVRISFLDVYLHVRNRFKKAGIKVPLKSTLLHASIDVRRVIWEKLGKPEICGEPGFTCTGCVSALDCKILNVNSSEELGKQRKACACLTNKKELLSYRKPCEHGCLYCYWKDN